MQLTKTILDEPRIRIDTFIMQLSILFAHLQYILQPIQRHLHNLGVHNREKIRKGADATLGHQVTNLVGGAATGGVRDGPRGLFPRFELGFAQDLDQDWEDVSVYHSLRKKYPRIILTICTDNMEKSHRTLKFDVLNTCSALVRLESHLTNPPDILEKSLITCADSLAKLNIPLMVHLQAEVDSPVRSFVYSTVDLASTSSAVLLPPPCVSSIPHCPLQCSYNGS
ncbi:unnamed protein product [Acanthoscelides obtectus]|uniref:Uncharacterized protein n=1 Tax=Acanthoscelides obtectus TaxID=200917 RepID=A0A9P0KEM7_ACAOB|nr:unnamed protein product [Acanthoscelides obtectus]CAK1647632.1 hypothetical protein AOBTE_LOCUS15311 [Acanthoscelides obtectus]